MFFVKRKSYFRKCCKIWHFESCQRKVIRRHPSLKFEDVKHIDRKMNKAILFQVTSIVIPPTNRLLHLKLIIECVNYFSVVQRCNFFLNCLENILKVIFNIYLKKILAKLILKNPGLRLHCHYRNL